MTEVRIAGAVAIGMWLLIGTWDAVTADQAALLWARVGVGVIVGLGLAARLLRQRSVAVVALQVFGLGAVAFGPSLLAEGPAALLAIPERLIGAVDVIRTGIAPLAPDPQLALAFVVALGILTLAADLVSATLHHPGWAAIPLLVVFAVPAVGLPGAVPTLDFVMLSIAVILVLAAGGIDDDSHARGTRGLGTRAASAVLIGLIGAGATAGAIGLREVWSLERPQRPMERPIEMNDPSLDLKRNLVEGSPEIIITFRTDQPDPPPLRLVSLTKLSDEGFHLTDTRIVRGPLPTAPGLRADAAPRTTQIEVGDFLSEWLPIPYAPQRVTVDERWGHTELGLEVLALGIPDRTKASAGMSYEVVSVDPRPSMEQLTTLAAGRPQDSATTLEVPSGVTTDIRLLVEEVTKGAATDGAKALAIQQFLLSNEFTYSTEPAPGTGVASLQAFLFETKTGYCEQFAGSMAAMARIAGIPSRIGVGFNPGDQGDDGSWGVSARNMHAWPELYFEQWGWVAFEPTPGGGGTGPGEAEPPAEEPSPSPAPPTVEAAEPEPEEATPEDEATPDDEATPAEPGWATWLLVLLSAALVIAAVAGGPTLVRRRQRRRRLDPSLTGRESALAAWAELEATASDLSLAWPHGSPRYVARAFEAEFGARSDAGNSLRRLAEATERAMYADPAKELVVEDLVPDVVAVTTAWQELASPAQARRAAWWPRSIWR